jgi:hypothetical protein
MSQPLKRPFHNNLEKCPVVNIWLPVHTDPVLSKQMDERIARLLTPALQGQPLGRTQTPTHAETRAENEKEAAPLPKAA